MRFRFAAAYDGDVMTALESMQVAVLESVQVAALESAP